jgi:hypothetical protein
MSAITRLQPDRPGRASIRHRRPSSSNIGFSTCMIFLQYFHAKLLRSTVRDAVGLTLPDTALYRHLRRFEVWKPV